LFCSTVGWALSLLYKFNCWANIYFEEGKQKIHRLNIEQSLKKVYKKCNRPVSEYRILVEYMIGDLKNYKALRTLWRHQRSKLVYIVETCTALVNRRRTLIKQGLSARLLVFNYSLPLMMLKITQTNCLFVNFEKRKKLNGIGNISFFK